MPRTVSPALASSTASDSPTYPIPTMHTRAVRVSSFSFSALPQWFTSDLLSGLGVGLGVGAVVAVVLVDLANGYLIEDDAQDGRARLFDDALGAQEVPRTGGAGLANEDDAVGSGRHVEVVGDEQDRRRVEQHELSLHRHAVQDFGKSRRTEP